MIRKSYKFISLLIILIITTSNAIVTLASNMFADATLVEPMTMSEFSELSTPPAVKTTTIIVTPDVPFYTVNGQIFSMDASPFIQDDRLLIPLCFFIDAIDAKVFLDENENAITILWYDRHIQFIIDSFIYTANNESYLMNASAIIKNNKAFVPMRFAGYALNIEVKWIDGQAIYTIIH